MIEASDFFFNRVIICDYATQDISGKILALGIVAPQIFFPTRPQISVPLFVIVTVVPLIREFQFDLEFADPDREVFFKVTCEYQKDVDPDKFEHCNYIFQLPQVQFRGFGDYTMTSVYRGRRSQQWHLNVAEGMPSHVNARVGYRTFAIPT